MTTGRVTGAGAPLGGVLVSDGRQVVATDADGGYALAGHGPYIVVSRPSGWTAERWYATPADVVDFALAAQAQPVPFSFVQVTDLHLSLGDTAYGAGQTDATVWLEDGRPHERIITTPQVLADLFTEIAADEPGTAFIAATGDLTNTGSHDELAAYADVVARTARPVLSVPGNHDLMVEGDANYALDVRAYERHLGPRYYSLDFAGVHIVVVDWFAWLLGHDREIQDEWVRADLAATPAATPVVMLVHDEMPARWYAALPRRPVATFSGHWHTSRVAEVDGTRHYNTPPATFGGLDYSPGAYRVATWDGAALSVRTVARGAPSLTAATWRSAPTAMPSALAWSTALAGGGHLAPPVVAGDLVLAVSKDEDEPAGHLEAFDAATGHRHWQVRLGSAVKAAPLVVGDVVVCADVTGETVCVDLADGAERWRTTLSDPLRLWVYLRPATDGTGVFVGDVACFSSLDLRDGGVRWSRSDLGDRANFAAHAHPCVVDGQLLVSFTAQVPVLLALDPATGETRWPNEPVPHIVYRGGQREVAAELPRTPVAGLTPDPDGRDVFVRRLGATIDRVRAADGSVVWSAVAPGWFSPAPPVVADDAVLLVSNVGELRALDRATGALRWATPIGGPAPLAFGSYRAGGVVALAAPARADGCAVVPTGDGHLVSVRLDDGGVQADVDVGVPVLAAPAVTDTHCIVIGVDGTLRAVPLDALVSGAPA